MILGPRSHNRSRSNSQAPANEVLRLGSALPSIPDARLTMTWAQSLVLRFAVLFSPWHSQALICP